MNKVTLFGRLGKDFELQRFDNDVIVAKNSLAITKKFINKDGDKVEHTDWLPITLFGKGAENANKYLKKGDKFLCEGEVNTNKYKDKDGKEGYYWQVIVKKFHFVDSKKDSEEKNTIPPAPQDQDQNQNIPIKEIEYEDTSPF